MKSVCVVGAIVLSAIVTIVFPTAVNRSTGTISASTQSQQSEMAKADFDKLVKSLSNWGRWGKDDQLGALNLITPEKRKQAAQLVTSGVSISLSRNVITVKIGTSAPFEQRMVKTGLTPLLKWG